MSDTVLAVVSVLAALVGVGVGAVAVPLLLDWRRERARYGRSPGRVWTRDDDDELERWRRGKI